MIKRYVLRAAVEGPFDGATPDERVREWTKNFPPNAVRRMTRLGLMLGAALRDFSIGPDDAVVYATTFGETITLARYLESFPLASPSFFQTSIHPSAVEQVLINRTCPVRELTPLAGQPDLSAQASLAALLTPGERVLLTGGEEVGSWMRQLDAASNVGFAFALELGGVAQGLDDEPPAGAVGVLQWRGEIHGTAPAGHAPAAPVTTAAVSGDLLELFDAVQARRSMRLPSPSGGEILLEWF